MNQNHNDICSINQENNENILNNTVFKNNKISKKYLIIQNYIWFWECSICNIIVTNGKLSVGDIAVAGSEYGKVRAILSDKGENLKASRSK